MVSSFYPAAGIAVAVIVPKMPVGSVKRLSSWLDGVITLSTFEAEILNFISRMGRAPA